MKKYILIFLIPFFGYSQDVSFEKFNNWIDPDAMSMKAIEVKDNLYIIEGIGGGVGNVGVFLSDDGIVMIDNQFEILEDLLVDKVRELSDKKIKYIINTHFHFDHADGNRVFGKRGIPIISHKNVRTRQSEIHMAYGGIYPLLDGFNVPAHEKDELPTITYDKKMYLHEGDETIVIYYFGKGHTDGDSIIKFEEANVVHTGDSYIEYGLPYVDMSNGGSIIGFINTLDDIISICDENTIVIPGHGGLNNVEGVKTFRDGLNHYYEMTLEGYKKGLSVEEISNSIDIPLGKTSGFGEPSIVKANFVRSILLENNIIL